MKEQRIFIKEGLENDFNSTIEQRVDRYLEVQHQGIIGAHYFSDASSECINLYRDGYFLSAVILSHAVNEGIIKFIAERNGMKEDMYGLERIEEFLKKTIISNECAQASKKIWGSYRNDIHHMNPKVAQVPFEQLAKKNLGCLAVIEKEIFGVDFDQGKLIPRQPQYWDLNPDGTVPICLRYTFWSINT